nr:hypothetical protein [uncultured Rhodopila sp.]
MHTFTGFTNDANTLRDRAAGVECISGHTRLLPILSASGKQAGVRVVVYVGDVFEESVMQGRRLADAMGVAGRKLVVLHDTADPAARVAGGGGVVGEYGEAVSVLRSETLPVARRCANRRHVACRSSVPER